MDKANYEGYARHAKRMSERVRMRKGHPELTAIDNKVIDIIKEKLNHQEVISLLDAGCGTGERFKMILERGKINPQRVKAVGVDFCDPLVAEARTKKLGEHILYERVDVQDLENLEIKEQFDVVICLFSVLNNVGKGYRKALEKLASCVAEEGVLVFDFVHPKAAEKLFGKECPGLVEKYGAIDENEYYYMRQTDNSWGKAFAFSFDEVQEFLKKNDLKITNVYDINNYKTKKGKFSVVIPYKVEGENFVPNLDAHGRTWLNSVLVVAVK